MEEPVDSVDHEEVIYLRGIQDMESEGLIDISNLASCEVSSSKQGCEINKLRDDLISTYWQSDGPQPHYLLIKFTKCVNISMISFYLNYSIDESYTPEKIKILAGSGEHDLIEVLNYEFFQPIGWQNINFQNICNNGLLKCYILKIKFISNHQNGKDCHVRCLKILSPINLNNFDSNQLDNDNIGFTSIKFKSESVVR